MGFANLECCWKPECKPYMRSQRMKTDFPDQMLVSTSSGEGRGRTNSRLSGDNKYIAVEFSGQQHSCPCGFVVLRSYQDLSISRLLVSVWDRGNRCDKMVVGKRDTLNLVGCIPLDRLRPLEGLQAFPPNSSPESVPGGTPSVSELTPEESLPIASSWVLVCSMRSLRDMVRG